MIKRNKCKMLIVFGVVILFSIAVVLGIAINIWNYGNVDEKAPADVAIV